LTLVVGGLVVITLSAVPFCLALAVSSDATTDPIVLEGLLWVSGSFGVIVIAVGLLLAREGATTQSGDGLS
jgi:hypothetical protein